jgi:drug/metabolite transporter (DMT)-like permease
MMNKKMVLLFLILANLFWAGNYIFGKYIGAELSPLQMTFLRWLLAVVFYFPIAHWVEHPKWKLVWKEWKLLVVMALLGIIGYNILLYQALRFTTAMNAALVNSINPAMIVLFSIFLLKERVSKKGILGLFISLIGVLLVLTNGQLLQIFYLDYNQGDLLMIVAILVWTFYSIVGKKMKNVPPISATAVSVLIGLVIMLPFFLASNLHFSLSKGATIGLLYIGTLPTVGSFIFWNISVREIGPSQAGVYLNLITVFTAILSILLGKSITIVQVVGGILVFIGVYLTSQKMKKTTTQKIAN